MTRMILLLAFAAACSREKSAAPAARAPSATAAAGAAAARCPLTVEQARAAVGAAMKGPDSNCIFLPADGQELSPRVVFMNFPPSICRGRQAAEDGYSEMADVAGTRAYFNAAEVGVLVCREGAPFEIQVDMENKEAARAAATALAKEVLAGR